MKAGLVGLPLAGKSTLFQLLTGAPPAPGRPEARVGVARVPVDARVEALAGMFSERSGIIDIGLEGKMLAAAFAAACIAMVTGSAWLGLTGAILVEFVQNMTKIKCCTLTYYSNHILFYRAGYDNQDSCAIRKYMVRTGQPISFWLYDRSTDCD